MAAGGDYSGNRHKAAITRRKVVELRDQGYKYQEICNELGISLSTAWNHYQQAMRDEPAEAIAKHRANLEQRVTEQLGRIDMNRETVMQILEKDHLTFDVRGQVILYKGEHYRDCKPVMDAIKLLVTLDDQEAKLLGLNAAQKLQADVSVNYTVSGVNTENLK